MAAPEQTSAVVNSQEETICFVHNWTFEIGHTLSLRDSEQFATVYNAAIYEWRLSLAREDNFNFQNIFFAPRNRNYQISLEPCLSSLNTRIPTAKCCSFDIKVVNPGNGEVVYHPEPFLTTPALRVEETFGFTAPRESSFGSCLKDMLTKPEYKGKNCVIVSTLTMPVSAFDIGEWPTAAKPVPPPEQRDFRFKSIYDTSTHDFTINTSDNQRVTAPKAILYACSPAFRRNVFIDGVEQSQMTVPNVYAAVETVVIYAVTGAFKAPQVLSPAMAIEILDCADRLTVINKKELKLAVEQMSCQMMMQHADEMNIVLEWLLTGVERDMNRLMNASAAIILNRHYNDFILEYAPNVSQRGALHERVHHRQGFFRPAPHTKLTQLRRSSCNVRPVKVVQG